MATTTSLTFLQMLHLPFAVGHILADSLLALILSSFRGAQTPKSFDRHMRIKIIHAVLGDLQTQQLQYLFGSTEYNYLSYVKTMNQAPSNIYIKSIDTNAF